MAECNTDGKLHCHVLTDDHHGDMPLQQDPSDTDVSTPTQPSPRQTEHEQLCHRHTILVFQERPSAATRSVAVLGMTVLEYAKRRRSGDASDRVTRAYIQYVDTTGLYQPRSAQSSLTRRVVAAYIKYAITVLHIEWLHLFATAMPSFLFAGSEECGDGLKRPLPGLKLIEWWLRIITSTVTHTLQGAATPRPVGYVHAPVDESAIKRRIVEPINMIRGSAIRWRCELPYPSKQPCTDHVPLFEDDPKWRHYEHLLLASSSRKIRGNKRTASEDFSMSVGDFFQSMQFRQEFKNGNTAFVVVRFDEQRPSDAVAAASALDIMSASDVAAADAKRQQLEQSALLATKMLASVTFQSLSVALESSAKLLDWLKLHSSDSFEICLDPSPPPPAVACPSKGADPAGAISDAVCKSGIANTASTVDTANIADAANIADTANIADKADPSSTLLPPPTVAPTVNSIQSLIKRKSTATQ